MNTEIENKDGKKIFKLKGKVDATTAQEVESDLLSNAKSGDKVELDLEDLSYVSSAGLRVILKLAKLVSELEITNVSSEVYNVFEMTGFSQLFNIQKGMRKLSIEGKELIGEGYMGKVYRLDPETIIKVYLRYTSMVDIEREIKLAKKAFILGIPTAIPFDVVKVKEGGFGSVFELINSKSLNSLMIENPSKMDHYISLYIDLLKTIMNTDIDDVELLPSKKVDALNIINSVRERMIFDEATCDKLEALVESIPEVKKMVHGDCHVKNIMMQGDEPLLIDMDTLGYGHPIFEIAAYFLTYIGYPASEPGNCKSFLGLDDKVCYDLFYKIIDELYSDRSKEERKEIVEKTSIFAYAWLADKTYTFEKENVKRFEQARQVVLELIDKYQTLNF